MQVDSEAVVEADVLRRLTWCLLALLGDAAPSCLASIEIGEIDLRFCSTSTTDGLPENITDTTLAVSSRLIRSFAGGEMSSLLESYSKSEKSPAVDEASSSEERYSSWGVCLKAGGSVGMVSFRPTRLPSRRDALRALFCGSIGGCCPGTGRPESADTISRSSISAKMVGCIEP